MHHVGGDWLYDRPFWEARRWDPHYQKYACKILVQPHHLFNHVALNGQILLVYIVQTLAIFELPCDVWAFHI